MATDPIRPWLDADQIRFPPRTESEKAQLEIYRSMSPAQRLEQAFRLRELAWSLKKAGLRTQHPDWSEEEFENQVRQVFLRASA